MNEISPPAVDQHERSLLERAGTAFGLEDLREARRTQGEQYHEVYRCMFSSSVVALKVLRERPELDSWIPRFEAAFAVEAELARRYSFLPRPLHCLGSDGGVASVGLVAHKRHVVAHTWCEAVPALPHLWTDGLLAQLGAAIAFTSRLSTGFAVDRTGMDDPVPNLVQLRERVSRTAALGHLDFLSERQERLVEDVLRLGTEVGKVCMAHRDLAPKNSLVTAEGALQVVDWENSGLSTLESEFARTISQLALAGVPLSSNRVRAFARPLQEIDLEISHFDLAWFGEWLRGHLMFLSYLVESSVDVPAYQSRVEREIDALARFADHAADLANLARRVA